MADIREGDFSGGPYFFHPRLTVGPAGTRVHSGRTVAETTMDIRRATIGEAALAQTILREAASWLDAIGQRLWNPEEIERTEVERRAAQGELVVGLEGGTAVACMYLQFADPIFWPEAKPEESLYVHRLAVRRTHAGKGWGMRLLKWADQEASMLKRSFVRLDSEPRPALLRLYEGAGFRRVDPTPLQLGGHAVVRFEKIV